jgi:rod shape-determining protein MreD
VLSTALSFSRSRAPVPYAGPSLRIALLWLALALVAQGTIMHGIVVRGAEPSLVLVTVVWYATRVDVGRATIFGLVAGVGEDLIAFDAGGSWTFATAIAALLASLPRRRFFEDSMPFFMIVTALATLVRDLLYWVLKKIEGFPAGLGTLHFHQALWQALLNALLAALVMVVARRFERRRATRWRR